MGWFFDFFHFSSFLIERFVAFPKQPAARKIACAILARNGSDRLRPGSRLNRSRFGDTVIFIPVGSSRPLNGSRTALAAPKKTGKENKKSKQRIYLSVTGTGYSTLKRSRGRNSNIGGLMTEQRTAKKREAERRGSTRKATGD